VTLIIGVLCSNGIVMGADGAATLGALGQHTVLQPVKKLNKIGNSVILAVSGSVGLGQRIGGLVNQLWVGGQLPPMTSFDAMTRIRQTIGPHLNLEIQYAVEAGKLLGMGVAAQSAVSLSMLAAPIEGTHRLYQFDHTGAPEEATKDLPFVALGSGQNLADPFLAFLREIFWKNSQPNLSEGVFATVWSLTHAIRRNTGGVAEPIQLMTLSKDAQDNYGIKEFDAAELQEHRQAVSEVEQYLTDFKRKQADPPPVPPPPPPPAG
jgi:20S proteasome alpha/beta subunit